MIKLIKDEFYQLIASFIWHTWYMFRWSIKTQCWAFRHDFNRRIFQYHERWIKDGAH